jgi:hypothetical protein
MRPLSRSGIGVQRDVVNRSSPDITQSCHAADAKQPSVAVMNRYANAARSLDFRSSP